MRLSFHWSLHTSGASPSIWPCDTRPSFSCELGGVWARDYLVLATPGVLYLKVHSAIPPRLGKFATFFRENVKPLVIRNFLVLLVISYSVCLSVCRQVFVSDVESHEPDLDEVEKVGSQFLGCAKVSLPPLVCFLVVEERRRRKKTEGVREG